MLIILSCVSLSWFVRSKWYIITFRCTWIFLQLVHWNIWAWSTSLFITTRIRLARVLEIKLEFFTDIDMLLTVEKGIRRGVRHEIHWYAKTNNKYTKRYNTKNELSYIMYRDANILYEWAMSQKLPVDSCR